MSNYKQVGPTLDQMRVAAGGSAQDESIPQGTGLRAKRDLSFKHPVSGRTNTIKAGSSHWVGNSQSHQERTGAAEIVKRGKPMGSGVHMRHEQVKEHFDIDE